MAEMGKYIYGVINSNTNFRLFISEDSIHTIPSQDISAVVGDSEILDYTSIPKGDVARMLVRHQKVIEKIMNSEAAIIPMRLGTFAQDENEVKDILSKGYNLVKEAMKKISGKIEIDVVATWSDFNSVLKEVGEDGEIKGFKESLLANPKGITVETQMKIGVMVKKALDKKRQECALRIENSLKGFSEDIRAHELMDDKMIINFAFLIEKSRREDFDKKVEDLNVEFNEKLNFRCVGPLPPYSFYTLEIKKMEFKKIDWARKKLGLDYAAMQREIKKAYQAQAFLVHPDKNPDRPESEMEFEDINKAYRILTDYGHACEQAGQSDRYPFNEDEFKKNKILVKVR